MPNYRGKKGFEKDKSKRSYGRRNGHGILKKGFKWDAKTHHRAIERDAINNERYDDLLNSNRIYKTCVEPWDWD